MGRGLERFDFAKLPGQIEVHKLLQQVHASPREGRVGLRGRPRPI